MNGMDLSFPWSKQEEGTDGWVTMPHSQESHLFYKGN
jgi:hypothetical protein